MKTKMITRRSRAAIAIAAVLAATAALGNPPEDEAIYEEFARTGVFDPEVPTAKAKELVVRGLFNSPTPRVELLTLQALAGNAMQRMWGVIAPSVIVPGVVERRFEEIPQLRDYLIAFWHKKVAEEGLPEPPMDRAIDSDENPSAYLAEVMPPWRLIPTILVINFPGDAKVHTFLVEDLAPLVGVEDHTLLPLFNAGRFKTPEADAVRRAHLSPDTAHGFFAMATRGLAMSRPEGGIEALIAAIQANKSSPARETLIVEAIVSYGPEAIPLLDSAGLEHISAEIVRMP